jgi:DNA-binding transcriptional LysR family regulator
MTDLRKIDVNLIVVLDAILNELNLTRAGEAVGMSQPAVSGALARLRQQFDDPLLVRNGRSFELTEVAQAIKPLVNEAMIEIQRTFDLLPTFDPATSTRTFHIGATDYLLSQMTSPLLKLLQKEAPLVDIDFNVLPLDLEVSLIDLLRRDVLIASATLGIPGKRQSLFSDSFVGIARKGNPLVKNGAIDAAGLAEAELVQMVMGGSGLNQVDQGLAQAGITPKTAISVRSVMSIPFMVSGTDLIGWVPEKLGLQYRDVLDLEIIETPLPRATLIESVHWHPTKSTDPAIGWLVSMLRKASELLEEE